MSIETFLYQLIFMPLQWLFEELYYIIGYKLTKDPGLAIIVLSLTVNLLVLPLYNRADAVQEAERETEERLRKGVEHIKKTFKGDEQLMMLQTYYRQNNYSPFDVIKGSISLFLEIPFFVAAYQFLSHLSILQGASLGPIKDLSAPDALLAIGGISINVLPIIMTVVNVLATALFVKGMALKTKLQLYGLAFFFLVFLYKSPSGLVFYWTLNNLFNLVKTAIYKFRKPVEAKDVQPSVQPQTKLFFVGACFMAVLTGLLIPSAVLNASPQEFIIFGYMENPLVYLLSSFAIAFGCFVIWLGVFYWLGEAKTRVKFEKFIAGFSLIGIITYMMYGGSRGTLSSTLVLLKGLLNTKQDKIINAVVLIIIIVVICKIWIKYSNKLGEILAVGCVAMLGMSTFNIFSINSSVVGAKQIVVKNNIKNEIVLSRNGKNVVLLMLDRAIGPLVPYIMQEKPELKQKFSGFTYYANTISFGGHTLFGSPPIFGGYEYTPVEMNKRSDMLLKDKHNEAMMLMPVLFDKLGYKSTVSNLPLVNYSWVPDYSCFEKYGNIRIEDYNAVEPADISKELNMEIVDKNKRNFFCYGLMNSLPLLIQTNFYGNGHYNRFDTIKEQTINSTTTADGYIKDVVDDYKALEKMIKRTRFVDKGDTFLAFTNDITHDAALLQMPDYTPSMKVDNSKIADYNGKNYTCNGVKLILKSSGQVGNYHVNMAAFLRLSEWFEYLRANKAYDNTRIILVSDHGGAVGAIKELVFNDKELKELDVTSYSCLLMVKDFDAKEFKVSNEFMTNADVPTIAVNGLISNPKNPFTGKAIDNKAYKAEKQYIIAGHEYGFIENSGNTYQPSTWYTVEKDIWNKANWQYIDQKTVLPN